MDENDKFNSKMLTIQFFENTQFKIAWHETNINNIYDIINIMSFSINILTQYFKTSNQERNDEIHKCLEINCTNPKITKIYLLNEKIYDLDILKHEKIIQIDVSDRLQYYTAFDWANKNLEKESLIILSNIDIIFDELAIDNIIKLSKEQINVPMAITRYELNNQLDYASAKLYSCFRYSQDCWIVKTPILLNDNFKFYMGIPGCDNRIAYELLQMYGDIINPCLDIKTYHLHNSAIRTYTVGHDSIRPPYCHILPYNKNIPHNYNILR